MSGPRSRVWLLLAALMLGGCHQRSDYAQFLNPKGSGPEAGAAFALGLFIIYPICACTAAW